MTRYRFLVEDHGVGIEVRAESPSAAWAALRSCFPTARVLDGPTPVGASQPTHDPVSLQEVLGVDRGRYVA
jgi:hypothetical protein